MYELSKAHHQPTPDPIEELRKWMSDSLFGNSDLRRIITKALASHDAVCAKLHLQETTQDPQPTIADYHQSQADLVELGKKLDAKCAEVERLTEELQTVRTTTAQSMVYFSLLKKFEASQAALDTANAQIATLREASEEARKVCYEGANSTSYVEQKFRNKCKKALAKLTPPTNEPTGEVA